MKLSIIANPEKYSVKDALNRTVSWCMENNHTVSLQKKLLKQLSGEATDYPQIQLCDDERSCTADADFVVAIGGDGTLLHTAQVVKGMDIPVLGINTGKLGFMANVQPDDTEDALQALVDDNFRIDSRTMLKATAKSDTDYYGLNEFLFTKKDTSSLITLDVLYNNEFLNRFWADGLIVATPTGSTAYNLSAGGPIIKPGTPVMVVTPINPHTLTTRPLVLPSDGKLEIKVKEKPEHILFSYDGKTADENLSDIQIVESNYAIKLVQLTNQTYFKTLRSKLMWGMDNREQSE